MSQKQSDIQVRFFRYQGKDDPYLKAQRGLLCPTFHLGDYRLEDTRTSNNTLDIPELLRRVQMLLFSKDTAERPGDVVLIERPAVDTWFMRRPHADQEDWQLADPHVEGPMKTVSVHVWPLVEPARFWQHLNDQQGRLRIGKIAYAPGHAFEARMPQKADAEAVLLRYLLLEPSVWRWLHRPLMMGDILTVDGVDRVVMPDGFADIDML